MRRLLLLLVLILAATTVFGTDLSFQLRAGDNLSRFVTSLSGSNLSTVLASGQINGDVYSQTLYLSNQDKIKYDAGLIELTNPTLYYYMNPAVSDDYLWEAVLNFTSPLNISALSNKSTFFTLLGTQFFMLPGEAVGYVTSLKAEPQHVVNISLSEKRTVAAGSRLYSVEFSGGNSGTCTDYVPGTATLQVINISSGQLFNITVLDNETLPKVNDLTFVGGFVEVNVTDISIVDIPTISAAMNLNVSGHTEFTANYGSNYSVSTSAGDLVFRILSNITAGVCNARADDREITLTVDGTSKTYAIGDLKTASGLQIYVLNITSDVSQASVIFDAKELALSSANTFGTFSEVEINGQSINGFEAHVNGTNNQNITSIRLRLIPSNFASDISGYNEQNFLTDFVRSPVPGISNSNSYVTAPLFPYLYVALEENQDLNDSSKSKVSLSLNGNDVSVQFVNNINQTISFEPYSLENSSNVTLSAFGSNLDGYAGVVAAGDQIYDSYIFVLQSSSSPYTTQVYEVVAFGQDGGSKYVSLRNLGNNSIENYFVNDPVFGNIIIADINLTDSRFNLTNVTSNRLYLQGGYHYVVLNNPELISGAIRANVSLVESSLGVNLSAPESFNITFESNSGSPQLWMYDDLSFYDITGDSNTQHSLTKYGTFVQADIDTSSWIHIFVPQNSSSESIYSLHVGEGLADSADISFISPISSSNIGNGVTLNVTLNFSGTLQPNLTNTFIRVDYSNNSYVENSFTPWSNGINSGLTKSIVFSSNVSNYTESEHTLSAYAFGGITYHVYYSTGVNYFWNDETVSFFNDVHGPNMSVTTPTNGQIVNFSTISLNLSVSDEVSGLDKCWYTLADNATKHYLGSCANTTISLMQGSNLIRVFANDTLGNTVNASKIVYYSNTNQNYSILEDSNVTHNISNNNTVYVVSNSSLRLNFTVNATNASLDFRTIQDDTNKTVRLGQGLHSDTAWLNKMILLALPVNVTINSSSNWTGDFMLPSKKDTYTVAPSAASGKTVSAVDLILDIGSNVSLRLDTAARLLLPGLAGKSVGYIDGGVFVRIDSACSSDTQVAGDALANGSSCKIDNSTDLIVWTKHFTEFVVFSETTTTSNDGSSGGGSSGGSSGGGAAAVAERLLSDQTVRVSALMSNTSTKVAFMQSIVDSITLTTKSNFYNVNIRVAVASLPSSVLAPTNVSVLQTLLVEHLQVADESISQANLILKVNKSAGVLMDRLTILRYSDGVWNSLPFVVMSQNSTTAVVNVTSPGLSYFVIANKATVVDSKPVGQTPRDASNKTKEVASVSDGEDFVVDTTRTDSKQSSKMKIDMFYVYVGIVLVVIILAAFLGIRRMKSSPVELKLN